MYSYSFSNISLKDLGIAYRKAKVDLYYYSRLCRDDLIEYEKNILPNLQKLLGTLELGTHPDFGKRNWSLTPKGFNSDDVKTNTDFIISDPSEQWNKIISSKKVSAEFRVVENLSIDFHVFSALWINKVGQKFEEKISSNSFGNRLRRKKNNALNLFALGSLQPYLKQYCQWRDNGITSMKVALENDKRVVAITADVSSFFHKIDASFMKDKRFHKAIGVTLSPEEEKLNNIFIDAVVKWASKTPCSIGLPVGLAASSVIANSALYELDALIEKQVEPLYYGRYVDDIIIVMENKSGFNECCDVWGWIFARCDGALMWKDESERRDVKFSRSYLNKSELHFSNEKNKLFFLSGASGRAFIETIFRQIQSRTSEWRALPALPEHETNIESKLLAVLQSDGDNSDSLRKADKLSVRRAGISIQLRDLEAYDRALPPAAWMNKRHAFLEAFIRHVLVLPTFFDLFDYLPRVVQLATHCGDFEYLRDIFVALKVVDKALEHKNCYLSIKASKKIAGRLPIRNFNIFRDALSTRIVQSIKMALPAKLSRAQKTQWEKLFSDYTGTIKLPNLNELQIANKELFDRDLAYRPFRQLFLPKEITRNERFPVAKKSVGRIESSTLTQILENGLLTPYKRLHETLTMPDASRLSAGLIFPTRPFNTNEIYILLREPFSESGRELFAEYLLILRGYYPVELLPERLNCGMLHIPEAADKEHKRVAVASWKTAPDSWIASVSKNIDPDENRLSRLCHLINMVLKTRPTPDYLIMPELSLPANWFLAVAHKLRGKGISLISGIEYLHSRKGVVHNQVWSSLTFDTFGFVTSLLYRQDKQNPAPHEESELWRVGGKTLKPQLKRWNKPPIIQHGEFIFSLLICSELTNIAHRASLRGNVDALFVPEWNQDTETFNPLVESAALDIHAYIIQCNDRYYGDSRIRAPYKDSWKRDIVRVKGGINDYFVVGDIDIKSLRQFQSSHRSPDILFKPVPDGFKISYERKCLPIGDCYDS